MTTSLTQVMSAIKEKTIGKFWLAYFGEKFQGEINDQLQEAFKSSGLTKADIARKLDRRPEQITRWLSAPSNLEAQTISDLALALGLMPSLSFEKVGEVRSNSRVHPFIFYCENAAGNEDTGRNFNVSQSTFNTLEPRLSATTDSASPIASSLSNKSIVTEVVTHAGN